jgi:hypothetical protein
VWTKGGKKLRNLLSSDIDKYRVKNAEVMKHWGSFGDETCGFFAVPSFLDSARMKVIASSGYGWEHVSVSRENTY